MPVLGLGKERLDHWELATGNDPNCRFSTGWTVSEMIAETSQTAHVFAGIDVSIVVEDNDVMSETRCAVLWQGLHRPGAEWCELARDGNGWRITGTALVAVGEEPFVARYDVVIDEDWSTREVTVDVRGGADTRERRLHVRADRERRWRIDREPAAGPLATSDDTEVLRGLIDIDLGFSPATNTLPIRRLAPAIGDAVGVTAVWVSFPELTIEPLPQRYIRLDERRYRYESDGGAFVTEIAVDDLGLVVTYDGGWRRIAES